MQRVLTTVTLLGLLVATAAAFAITEHLKLTKGPLLGARASKFFSPTCDCAQGKAEISIKLRHADHVTLTILDSGRHPVATIASGAAVPARRATSFHWNGRTDTGATAPDGDYYPKVSLAHARHAFSLIGTRIVLDTKPPEVLSATAERNVLFIGPGRGISISYVLSEPANAVVYLGGHKIIRGRPTRTHAKVKWTGGVQGRPVSAGTYVLSVGAKDAAGNRTPPAGRKNVTVVVRYIDVAPRHITVRAGSRFDVRVVTKARRYTWRLGGRHGTHLGSALRLRAPTTPGTYRLSVTVPGQTAVVGVRVK